ncbi:MAG: TonB-dependent receptor [Muribaculaceae bacterium]|nr:TonB-dependent receptor [Muribaculaceae bacterium]
MEKLTKLLFFLMLSFASSVYAQNVVTGEVVDEKSEPLIGATVMVKGTTIGASTDLEGKFSIAAKVGDILNVSYVGFESESVKVPESKSVRIVLKEISTGLDEVVVVGVSMKKSDLTGAVSQIDGSTLTEKPVTTINDALAGRMPGVSIGKASSPSESSSVKVRGTNTINAGSSPIYVIDGLVMDDNYGSFNSINVNDVESIQVLKDASATALYGSRGANGVIVITTKKARLGEGKVTYDGWVKFTQPGHAPAMMDANGIWDLRTESFANGYMYNNPDADRLDYINNVLWNEENHLAFENREFLTHKLGRSYNWLDQVTRTGFEQNHSLSFSKATEKTNIYLSFGLSDLNGIMKGTEQRRYSGRANISVDIKSWLRVGTNTSFTYTNDEMTDGSVYGQARGNGNPLLDYNPFMNDETRYDQENLTLFWRVQSGDTNNNFNPFNTLYDINTERSRYHLISSNYVNINPIAGLNIRSTFSINRSEQKWAQFIPTKIQQAIRYYGGDNFAKQQRDASTQWQWDNTVSYDKTFADVHRLNAFAGMSMSRYVADGLWAQGRRFASDDLGFNALGSNADVENRSLGNYLSNSSLLSYVVRGNYNYDYRYFVTVTGRWDGSSKFGKGHKWGFFPSFSLAWNLANEPYFPKTDWINTIKLRGGYGSVGNQNIGDFLYLTLYSPYGSDGIAGYNTDGRRGTPNITWEKQKQGNIGIDLAFFDNRLTVSADGFWITNSDLLYSHSLASSSGYTYTTENVGEMTNRGFELSIGATPIRTADWTWNVNFNLGMDHNKITKLYGGVDHIYNGTNRTGNLFIGESLNNLYCLRAGGIANEWNRSEWEGKSFNGRTVGLGDLYALDISGPDGEPDDVVDQYDRVCLGSMDPKGYGGFSTDLTWKGITLNAIFTYSFGGRRISDFYESLISSDGRSNASPDLVDSWRPDNTNAYFPRRMYNADGYSAYGAGDTDRYVQKSDFLKLTNLSLSYTFPKSILRKIRFDNLRVYFTAGNVFTATKYKGYDPEWGDGSGYFPTERSYTIGLSFTF